MALISREKRFAYFHFPRTGGTSLGYFLRPVIKEADLKAYYFNNDHKPVRWYRDELGEVWESLHKWATVRNPFSFLLSFYWYLRRQDPRSEPVQVAVDVCRRGSFDELVWNVIESGDLGPSDFAACVRLGQVEFHSDENGNLLLDEWFRLEELSHQHDRIAEICGVPDAIPHANAFTPEVWRDHRAWYRPETRRAVERFYARDFEVFGYCF